jgi:hypothetical protein
MPCRVGGTIQEIRTVEITIDELKQHLKDAGLEVGDLLETLMEMMKFRDLI